MTLTRQRLLDGVRDLCARDDGLADVVARFGPPPLWGRRPGYASLVRIVLEQQVSLASGAAAYTRLRHAVGRVTPHRVAAATPARLRRAGLTRQKSAYCRELACRIVAGELDLHAVADADDHAARRTLLQIRGIGPWTADIYLLMALRRPDVWPDGDLALAESMRRVRKLRKRPSTERQRRIAAEWKPWRAVAARLLWHAYLRERRRLQP